MCKLLHRRGLYVLHHLLNLLHRHRGGQGLLLNDQLRLNASLTGHLCQLGDFLRR